MIYTGTESCRSPVGYGVLYPPRGSTPPRDFAAFARNCGARGIRVTVAGELDAALEDAFAHGPAMVKCSPTRAHLGSVDARAAAPYGSCTVAAKR
jgi:thiamine pyrophosphate-dependent acetolactate synthase large subunit-like protein